MASDVLVLRPPFDHCYTCIYSPSQDSLIRYVKRKFKDDIRPMPPIVHGWVESSKSREYIAIWIPDRRNLSVVGHECLHAAIRCLQFYGENPMRAEETLCLTWEYLFNAIRKWKVV